MKILFENATLVGGEKEKSYIVTENDKIVFVGDCLPDGNFDRRINCKGKILTSALYNTHSHIAMTVFRGLGGDLPVQKWLDNVILPLEDSLTEEKVRAPVTLGMAEMIRTGTVSFSDMYMFTKITAEEAIKSGMKANIARGLVCFDDEKSIIGDERFEEARNVYDEFNGEANGRIKIDFAVHAEYTAREKYTREVREYAERVGARLQAHLSEGADEVKKCYAKRGMTQTEFFERCGYFDLPVTLAHCVHLTDSDIDILESHKNNVFISHNPTSNLKLASGIMRYSYLLERGFTVSLGTDGAASNNRQDMFREINLSALLAKGITQNAALVRAEDALFSAQRAGALSQGRELSGEIKVGAKADIILVDTESLSNIPAPDAAQTLVYSASGSDVTLTMCDGKILYEDGRFNTIDVERAVYEIKKYI